MAIGDKKKSPPAKPRAWSLHIALYAAYGGRSGRPQALKVRMPPTQSPKLLPPGQASPFPAQTPFTV